MNKTKEILEQVGTKRFIYIGSIILLAFFSIALNIAFSTFTNRQENVVANIKVKNMAYNIKINGIDGTKITVAPNKVTTSNLMITSLNEIDSKYELIYKICSDSSCTLYIDKPSFITVEYSSKTIDPIYGAVTSSGGKQIRIAVTNTSATTYYIELGINAGYIYNTLVLQNLITEEYNEEDIKIAALIDGILSTTFPTTNIYTTTVSCTTNKGPSNASGTATWNGSKWVVNVTGADSGQTVCNVNFTAIPLLTNQILGINNSNVTTTQTMPGRAISGSSEAVLSSTADDYGTSYYYRGNVQNNYIVFASMCWRIVRVTGSGATKIILYNYNPNGVANPCDVSQDGTSNAFARYSGTTFTSTFNTTLNRNAYIGFMYGTPGSSNYAAEHANINKSTILANLESWYNTKLTSYENLLADTIWCNDKQLDVTYPVPGQTGYGTTVSHYLGRGRIFGNGYNPAQAAPTLVCPNDSNGGKLSKFTVADTINGNGALSKKIGLLTADEAAFAGAMLDTANTNYYLTKNATSNIWWLMTPTGFNYNTAFQLLLKDNGALADSIVNTVYALRPSVALNTNIRVTGIGTSANPYRII